MYIKVNVGRNEGIFVYAFGHICICIYIYTYIILKEINRTILSYPLLTTSKFLRSLSAMGVFTHED